MVAAILLFSAYASAYATTAGIGPAGYIGNGSTEEYIISAGEATVSVDSSVMIAHLEFVGRGATARQAYDDQHRVMEKVIEMLKSKGVYEMQTANLVIEPIYGERKDDPYWHSYYSEVSSYMVRNTLVIKVRNQSMSDDILVSAIDLGVNEITNMRFIPDSETIKNAKNKVREEALRDAKENAIWQAQVINRTLDKPVYVGDPARDIVTANPYGWWNAQDQMLSNVATQTSVYLSSGQVDESEGLSPGRMTFSARVSIGYMLKGE